MENDPNPYSTPGSDVFSGSSAMGGGEVTDGVLDQLRRTRGWVKFLGILAFIGAGLILLIGLVMISGGGALASMAEDSSTAYSVGYMAGMGLYYIVLAFFYIYPGVKLWKYGKRIDQLMQDRASLTLEAALNEQRSLWKYIGVLSIIGLSLAVLGVGIGVILAMFAIGS